MRYLTFSETEHLTYKVAFLVPSLQKTEIESRYIDPFMPNDRKHIIAYDLFKEKKTSVKVQKEYLEELLPVLQDLDVKYLVVCDADYYKTLTKSKNAENNLGYVKDSVMGNFKVVYCPNFQRIFHDPDRTKAKIFQSMVSLIDHISGKYKDPGKDIVKFAAYPKSVKDIKKWLQRLLDMDVPLTSDIEGYSLKHYDAGIGTITFCWNKHEGIAFPVDYGRTEDEASAVRKLLKEFFTKFTNKLIWHNISFDVYVLIYQLFMENLIDTEGLLGGLPIMLRNWDDTKLITYLATNTCAGNKLGLKYQSQEFSGNYAVEEINDITKIDLDDLLRYNLIDGLSTWYVYDKHYQTMVDDQQEEIYNTLFKPAIWDIIQMQLTGLPIDMKEVQQTADTLQSESDAAVDRMRNSTIVPGFEHYLKTRWVDKKNSEWKKKRITVDEVPPTQKECIFNPNSGPQLQKLLFDDDFLGLPVLEFTDTKLPATGQEVLEKLIHHTDNPEIIAFLENLLEFTTLQIFLTTFIPRFLEAPIGPDGWHYLFGNFNLGGTVSGRLSSSKPNLQNIPSSGATPAKRRIAKMIKKCFKAPPGWLFCGLDFASLEDRISALTTKDPNKLKVYTDGFDGHSLRAYTYFEDQMPDINPNSVDSINSIAKKYKPLRQESKAPTFALTYQGTFHTLIKNCGFSEEKAKRIEKKYHEMYRVSDAWVQDRLEKASQQGYVTVAFGLRVRTPLLKQVILGTSRTPYEAAAEGRTAGNAMGQSYGLLNSRASVEFMGKVRQSDYRLDIRPCAHIHDAQYYMIKDDINAVHYTNTHLVKAVEWQELPEIQHPEVHLGGNLSIFHPTWNDEIEIANHISPEEIRQTIQKKISDREQEKLKKAA